MVSFVKNDLEFILRQIEIAEAHANGADLADLIENPLLPYGLRTVDGTYNNIIEGREEWGAADTSFPRLTGDPVYTTGTAPGGPFPVTNTDYSQNGDVVDTAPRTISNLIVDQTVNNPAAITAALKWAGITGSEAAAIVNPFVAAQSAANAATAAITQAQAEVNAAQAALQAAQTGDPTLAAYDSAIDASASAASLAASVATSVSALLAVLQSGAPAVDASDLAALSQAQANLVSLSTAASQIVAALQAGGSSTAADLPGANEFATLVGTLQGFLTGINLADGSYSGLLDTTFANLAGSLAPSLVTGIADLQSQLIASQDAAEAANPAIAAAQADLAAAQAALAAATEAASTATAAAQAAEATLTAELAEHGIEISDNGSISIPNVAPDEGISAPFNSWMTLFGQFFDHGLDLVAKGDNGTVYVPLQDDDPLIAGQDGVVGTPDDLPAHLRFMALTRATPDGEGSHTNTTTAFVDQNQTYTSHPSHQVFLREYAFSVDSDGDGVADSHPVATGHLLEHEGGGLATWADVKAQAQNILGINLTDADVGMVPLLRTDPYGNFIPGANGLPQIVTGVGLDGIPNTADDVVLAGNLDSPASLASAIRTDHAFLDDIAHAAVPFGDLDHNPNTPPTLLAPDANTTAGGAPAPTGFYDNELLDAHKVAGDGRANENIGLTAVHHVFHSEHNRLVEHTKDVVIDSGDLDFVKQWLAGGEANPLTQQELDAINALTGNAKAEAIDALNWDGERLFQAARFGTEMQYQHLVFEEFARKVNPAVDLFVFNPTMDVDPSIFAEFAHVVYRFGHSMLTEEIDILGPSGQNGTEIGLIEAFLNPIAYDGLATTSAEAAGAIIRGMTRQTGNEIDEFVTDALRNNLLGLPLDLATINMTRARETGVPSLNEAREQFFEMTQSEWLKPYASWVDFAQHLKNPASIVNFIAAYGTHESILAATTLEAKRDAATLLVLGDGNNADGVTINGVTYTNAQRLAFLNGTSGHADLGGLDNVDLWVGGLAEAILPFGGMLGSTFTFVFEAQMENLQNGDRFYYLSRTQGLHFITELENNAFSKLIMLNTDLGTNAADEISRPHIPGEVFASVDHILETVAKFQADYDPDNVSDTGIDPTHDDPFLNALEPKVARDLHLNGDDGVSTLTDGSAYDHSLKFTGGEHVVLGGTDENDVLIADLGDDTIWGDGGDDLIIGGHGINRLHGGTGDDIIYGGGDPEFLHGDEGNDAIQGGNGLGDLIFGGDGSDFVVAGIDGKEVFAGQGNDFVVGTPDVDILIGNEGDDWLEGAEGFDTLAGDNSELFFNSTVIGHDVLIAGTNENDFDAESGDDIMVQGESVMRNEGMLGFDWAIFKDMEFDAYADMRIPIFTTVEADILRNRFDHTEALSGWDNNDTLIGDDRTLGDLGGGFDPGLPPPENTLDGDELTVAGIARIDGLDALLQPYLATLQNPTDDTVVFEHGNLLLGGDGNDTITGNGGDDIIDGDAWLNVRIGIMVGGVEIGTANYMQEAVEIYPEFQAANPGLDGVPLDDLIFLRKLNPSQLQIVREVLQDDTATAEQGSPPPAGFNIDVAVFRGALAEYTVTTLNGTIVDLNNLSGPILEPLRVAHTGGALNGGGVNDGVDIVTNVEVLQFGDRSVNIGPVANGAPTGNVALSVEDGITAVGQTFSVLLDTLDDPNGLPGPIGNPDFPGGFTISWQFEATPGAGDWEIIEDPVGEAPITGATFTPTAAMELEGLRIRAVVSFVDDAGFPEVVISAATAPLAAQATGIPTIGDDILFGTAGNDTINALAGNDEVFGFGGNDTLIGGPGDDLLDGGDGDDTLTGGNGNDELIGGAGTDTAVFNGNLANFTIEVTPDGILEVVNAAGTQEDSITGIEFLQFNDDILSIAEAEALAGIIRLPAGGGTATGTAGVDVIFGGDGGDTIDGLGGNDLLNGGGGADSILAGGGADTVNGGDGNDGISGDGGADVLNGDAGDDEIFGIAGADTIDGGVGNDFIDGGIGADTLFGNDGDDDIFGDAGADTIDGGAGRDVIFGGAGADIIDGGLGDDDLTGDAGVDTFVFNANFGGDTILDFDDAGGGQDIIDLVAFGLAFEDLTIVNGVDGVEITSAATIGFGKIVLDGVFNNAGGVLIGEDDFQL